MSQQKQKYDMIYIWSLWVIFKGLKAFEYGATQLLRFKVVDIDQL